MNMYLVEKAYHLVILTGVHIYLAFLFLDDPAPQVGTDIDLQLLEAAKAGDMEVVKVSVHIPFCFVFCCVCGRGGYLV